MGVGTTSTVPGARQDSTSWTDLNGDLWLFGGYGHDVSDAFGKLQLPFCKVAFETN
jgi:hypothetical protein